MTGLMDKGKMQPSGICIRLCQSGFDQNRLAVQVKMGRILVFINPDSYLIKSGHAKNGTINGQCPICDVESKKVSNQNLWANPLDHSACGSYHSLISVYHPCGNGFYFSF